MSRSYFPVLLYTYCRIRLDMKRAVIMPLKLSGTNMNTLDVFLLPLSAQLTHLIRFGNGLKLTQIKGSQCFLIIEVQTLATQSDVQVDFFQKQSGTNLTGAIESLLFIFLLWNSNSKYFIVRCNHNNST